MPVDSLKYLENLPVYTPKKGEEYMSPEQLEHFKNKLLLWKKQIMEEVDQTINHMKEESSNPADPSDRATLEEEFALELRTRDRERKLLKKIEESLKRIETGDYGYCKVTGDEIGIARLDARPTADMTIEAKTRQEQLEKQGVL
jgi:DnaK suppressor protein